jgi:hypothetical protein
MSKLSELVATRVMGWKIHPRNTAHYMRVGDDEVGYRPVAFVSDWKPDTNISAAWEVKQVATDPIKPIRRSDGANVAVAFVNQFESAHLWALSEREAAKYICVMALRAVGVSEAEIQEAMN